MSGACVNAAAADDALVHKDNPDNAGSSTVPVKEESSATDSSFDIPRDLEELQQQIQTLSGQANVQEQEVIAPAIPGFATSMVMDGMKFSSLQFCAATSNPTEIIAAVGPELFAMVDEHGHYNGWSNTAILLCALRNLEIIVGALLLYGSEEPRHDSRLKHCHEQVDQLYRLIPTLMSRTDAPAEAKAALLVTKIRRCNKEGWPTYSGEDVKYTVPSQKFHAGAILLFQEYEELSAHEVWRVLSDCVEVKMLNNEPSVFDPLFHARKGVMPAFFFKYWETIVAEINNADVLAS